jgi:NADH:ubiquinone oxidoreductase subunit 3 (subunit A)
MLQEWLYIGIFLIIAPIIPGAAILLTHLIGPKKSNRLKRQTYECGVETYGPTWVQFRAQYYIYALVFLIFEVELVFLYPWAVAMNQIPLFAVFEGALFILILAAGLIYAWKKGTLQWI